MYLLSFVSKPDQCTLVLEEKSLKAFNWEFVVGIHINAEKFDIETYQNATSEFSSILLTRKTVKISLTVLI